MGRADRIIIAILLVMAAVEIWEAFLKERMKG